MGLDFLPLWTAFLATNALVLLSVEGGIRLGRHRRSTGAAEQEGPVTGIVGATLALLAFLITFTFGLAASRFEVRRQAVLDEANAIGTTSLRTGFLPEPHRAEVRRLLREYVTTRLAGSQAGHTSEAIVQSEALQTQLWSQADQVAALDSRSVMTGLFIQALNDTIDMHSTRLQALRGRIPLVVWIVIGFVTMLAMATAGYQEGVGGSRRSPAILALVLSFSGVMTLITDLDRPHEGLLRVSQQPMLDLQRSMQPPAK
jgi:hypothetical protein